MFLNSKHNHYKDGTANPFLICPAAEWPQMGKDVCLLSVGWQGLSLVEHLEVIPQLSESVAWQARNICVTDKGTSLCEPLLSPCLWNTLYAVHLTPGEPHWWGLHLRRRQGSHSVSSPFSLSVLLLMGHCAPQSFYDLAAIVQALRKPQVVRDLTGMWSPMTNTCSHEYSPGTMTNGQNTLFSSKEFN